MQPTRLSKGWLNRLLPHIHRKIISHGKSYNTDTSIACFRDDFLGETTYFLGTKFTIHSEETTLP